MPEFSAVTVTELFEGHIDDPPPRRRIGVVVYDLRFPPWKGHCPFVMSTWHIKWLDYVKEKPRTE